MAKRDERYITVEQYLALEAASPGRHEYFDGRVYATTGGTANHARVIGGAYSALASRLRARPCEVFVSEIKVRVEATGCTHTPISAAIAVSRGSTRTSRVSCSILR